MSRYNNANANQYGNYYDPVGSNTNQPSGYTYQPTATPASTSGYSSTNPSNYSTGNYTAYHNNTGSAATSANANHTHQQYGTAGQTAGNGTSRTAATLSSLASADYNQSSSTQPTTSTHDNSSWGSASYNSGTYANNNLQMPNRAQSNNSPAYATQASSNTLGRSSVPEQQGHSSTPSSYPSQGHSQQSGRTSATVSAQSYPSTYAQPAQTQQQQPARYSSPMHAQQAQRQHPQPSRASNYQPAPQTTTSQTVNRQQSASVEPSPATVNPSQVYDDRAEKQRKAQIEAEKRRKREAKAARKAEEERLAAEAEAARKVAEDKVAAEEDLTTKRAEYARKAEEKRKAREEKRQSKTAATALTKMASSGGSINPNPTPLSPENDNLPPPANAEEAEMRAMFKKMREFNARNPAMLAKLWEEERKAHSMQSPTQPAAQSQPATKEAAQSVPKPASKTGQQKKAAPAAPTVQQQEQSCAPSATQAPPASQPAAAKPVVQRSTVNTILWPPQKKGTLAEAAVRWLLSLPENVGKSIRREDILRILESNPSYVQLCEALEGLGLQFQRAHLARELLRSGPDGFRGQLQPSPVPATITPLSAMNGAAPQLNSSVNKGEKQARTSGGKTAASTERPASSHKTVNYETPGFPSLSDSAREVNNMGRDASMIGGPVQPPMPIPNPSPVNYSSAFGGATSRAPFQSQPPIQPPVEKLVEVKPKLPMKPPANKEEAARKRTFGDLVDLTVEESDEDAPPPKLLQPPSGPITGVNTQQLVTSATFRQPSTFNSKEFSHQANMSGGPVQGLQPLRIAAMEPPQQYSPFPTQASSKPSSPKPKPKPRGPTAEQLQQERLRGRMLVEPIMRDRVARKSQYDTRTIARDVLLATGRHPDMRALNAHLNSMQKMLGDHGGSYETDGTKGNRSDLSTIRWDIIDPGMPEDDKVKLIAAPTDAFATTTGLPTPAAQKVVDEVDDADDEDDAPAPEPQARAIRQATVNHGDGTVSYVSVYVQPGHKAPVPKKRRGRPPRYSVPDSTTLAVEQGERQRPTQHPPDTSTRTRPTGMPARQDSAGRGVIPASAPAAAVNTAAVPSAGQAIGYGAFQQVDENGKKKKGRPFGWRKNVHSREANGLTPLKNPPKSGSKVPSRLRELQEPEYQVYKCQWEGCAAELHNLDTLKKHVVKIHGRAAEDGEFECHWVPCEGEQRSGGKGKARVTDLASFSGIESWMSHMDKQHLQPVGWQLGDGPRGGVSGTDSEAPYLSDAQGRSVTPIIQPHNVPTATDSARMATGRLREDGMTKEERRAAAELSGLTAHKRAVGPAMGKTGSTLASPKRRLGFLDDEDFEDEIGSEGEGGG